MFALWYSSLYWREYKDVILDKLSARNPPATNGSSCTLKKPPTVCPLPKRPESTPIPIVEPPKPAPKLPQPELPKIQKVAEPLPPPPPQPRPLEPPAKPPRSPSPHPMRTEAFEDIEYEEEDSEAEDDENSVIDSNAQPPRSNAVSNSVNDFIKQEISQQKTLGLNQR